MIKLCSTCNYSKSGKYDGEGLYCTNPDVNRFNWQYLSAKIPSEHYVHTSTARRGFFVSCGLPGRLWELKHEDSNNN